MDLTNHLRDYCMAVAPATTLAVRPVEVDGTGAERSPARFDRNARGFDPAAPASTDTEAEAFRARLTENWACTARLEDRAVAAGRFTPPYAGVAELVGLTTLKPYRRRESCTPTIPPPAMSMSVWAARPRPCCSSRPPKAAKGWFGHPHAVA